MNFHSSRYAVMVVVIAVGLVMSNRINAAVNWAKVVAYGSDAENAADIVQLGKAKKKFLDNTWGQISRTIDGKQSAAQMDKNVWRKSRGGTVYELMRDMPGTEPIMKIVEYAENTKQRLINTVKQAGATKDNISKTINNKLSWKSQRHTDSAPSRGHDGTDKDVASTGDKRNYYDENYDANNPYDPWAPKPEQADDSFNIAKSHEFSDYEHEDFQEPGDEDTDLEPFFGAQFGAGPDGSMTYNITAGENNVLGLPGATGGNGELTYTISPGLPSGMVFDSFSRTIEGSPHTHGTQQTYTLQAMDEDGDTDTLTFRILARMNPKKLVNLFNEAKEGLQSQADHKQEVMTGIARERSALARENQAASNALLMQTLQNSMGRGRANTFQAQQNDQNDIYHFDLEWCLEHCNSVRVREEAKSGRLRAMSSYDFRTSCTEKCNKTKKRNKIMWEKAGK